MRWYWIAVACWMLVDCSKQRASTDNVVPSPPVGAAAWPPGPPVTYAINQIFLGDVDRNGNANAPIVTPESGCGPSIAGSYYEGDTSWKAYGYDLDRLITTKSSSDVCSLWPGSPKSNQIDGNNGNDNSWGLNYVGLAGINVSADETTIIQNGGWTLQVQIDALPTSDAIGVHARIFTGGAFTSGVPAFDATTSWPVLASSLIDGQTIAGGAIVEDDNAYVTGGTFVSAPSVDMPITLPLELKAGPRMVLRIHRPVVTFSVPASDPTTIVNGTIAGVLETTEFLATAAQTAHGVSTSVCGAAFDGIAQLIQETQDIFVDETNQAGSPCDAISIGIGFNAKRIANPTAVVPDPAPPPDPCSVNIDAGTDAGLAE